VGGDGKINKKAGKVFHIKEFHFGLCQFIQSCYAEGTRGMLSQGPFFSCGDETLKFQKREEMPLRLFFQSVRHKRKFVVDEGEE